MDYLREKVKKVNSVPGVYFWKDKKNEILYIGRSSNLRNRLNQYFSKNIDSRIKEMMSQAVDFKVIKTSSLLEAIILEAKYIKDYWPKYNIKDRDDKSFIYIVIPEKEFSYPIIIRGKELDQYSDHKNIFGPYQSITLIKNALRIIRRIFPYGTCQPMSSKACFDHQIGLCPGSCIGLIDRKKYDNNIKNIILLLSGKNEVLIKKLSKENPDQARALKHLQDVSLLENELSLSDTGFKRIEAYDISHFSGKDAFGAMVVFNSFGLPEKKDYRLFKIKKKITSEDDMRSLQEVLERRFAHKEWGQPDLVIIDGGSPQLRFLLDFFKKENFKNVLGVSKFSGDKVVFLPNADNSFKNKALKIKRVILRARDESHRFSNNARKRFNKNLHFSNK
jgi:excinuclease ABC subunit C